MPIFPPEIIDNSVETHFVKNNIRSKVLYISVLVALVLFVASMPFIVIDISTQARGIIGNFVSPSQTIAYVSANDNLLVECYVSPTDIGYISINQDIKFQLDAFNYNQWGMATGVVQEISEDISTINNKPVFKVRCLLHNKYLSLNTGYKGYLKKGMTLTGRFYLTNRTLWQLLFDKINDWVNPKLVLK